MSEATGRQVLRVLPLLAIVALGVQLRLTFYQGVIHTDDLVYSHLAQRLAEGISPFTAPLPPVVRGSAGWVVRAGGPRVLDVRRQ